MFIRLKWCRDCPVCGNRLSKEDPKDLLRCGSCGWEEKLRPWPEMGK